LDLIYDGFSTDSWSGSRADILEFYLPLLEDLLPMGLGDITEWVVGKTQLLRQQIRWWRESDEQRNSSALLGFE